MSHQPAQSCLNGNKVENMLTGMLREDEGSKEGNERCTQTSHY